MIPTDLGALEQREAVLAKQPGAHELRSLICGPDSPQAGSKMPTSEIQGITHVECVETGCQLLLILESEGRDWTMGKNIRRGRSLKSNLFSLRDVGIGASSVKGRESCLLFLESIS